MKPSYGSSLVKVSEAQFQKAVIELAHRLNWRVAHFHKVQNKQGRWLTPVAADGGGWPDLVLVKGPHLIFAELKADGKQLQLEQAIWKDALEKAGAEFHCWKPADWNSIEYTLGGSWVAAA